MYDLGGTAIAHDATTRAHDVAGVWEFSTILALALSKCRGQGVAAHVDGGPCDASRRLQRARGLAQPLSVRAPF